MSIIVPSDFKGEITIAQVSGTVGGVSNTVQGFIDKYESKFLKELLGTTLANQFVAGLAVLPTIDPIWISLRDTTDLKEMLKCYIYYWYVRNEATQTAGMGEVIGKTDNATHASSSDKLVRAWNEMSKMAREFMLDITVYPSFVKYPYMNNAFFPLQFGYSNYGFRISDIYYPINKQGI